MPEPSQERDEPATPVVAALYDDRAAAQRGADALLASGVPLAKIRIHDHGPAPRNEAILTADEYATGGFFANFGQLITGLFDTPLPPGDASSYDEVVRRDGAVVMVDAADAAEAASLEARLRDSGASQIGRLPAPARV